jgi:hypothetical protein
MGEKPTAAFVLSLIGGIIILLVGVFVTIAALAIGAYTDYFGGLYDVSGLGTLLLIFAIFGLVCGILVVAGAAMMYSEKIGRVRAGAILVLIFSILSWFGTTGGLIVGFILGLIGAILGLVWKPSRGAAAPPPPPP